MRLKFQVLLLYNLNYVGIPKYYEAFKASEKESILVMESLGDSLYDTLERHKLNGFPIKAVSNIAIQLVSLISLYVTNNM